MSMVTVEVSHGSSRTKPASAEVPSPRHPGRLRGDDDDVGYDDDDDDSPDGGLCIT